MYKVDNVSYKYRLIDRYSGKEYEFNTKDELIAWMMKKRTSRAIDFLEMNRSGIRWPKYNNGVLDQLDNTGLDKDENGEPKRYILFDGYGRIIDGRIYEADLDKAYEEYLADIRKQWKRRKGTYYFKFRSDPVPHTGRGGGYSNYYRSPRMINVKRQYYKEVEHYSRPKACHKGESMWWDDYPRTVQRSWKAQGKKKRQWM